MDDIDHFLDGNQKFAYNAMLSDKFYDDFGDRFLRRLHGALRKLPSVDIEAEDAYDQEVAYQHAFREQAENLYTEFNAMSDVILGSPENLGVGLLVSVARDPAFNAFFSSMRMVTNVEEILKKLNVEEPKKQKKVATLKQKKRRLR